MAVTQENTNDESMVFWIRGLGHERPEIGKYIGPQFFQLADGPGDFWRIDEQFLVIRLNDTDIVANQNGLPVAKNQSEGAEKYHYPNDPGGSLSNSHS